MHMAKSINTKDEKAREEEPSKHERVTTIASQTGRMAGRSQRSPMQSGPKMTPGNRRVPLKRNY